jgi:hypothetical protein
MTPELSASIESKTQKEMKTREPMPKDDVPIKDQLQSIVNTLLLSDKPSIYMKFRYFMQLETKACLITFINFHDIKKLVSKT